MHPGHCCVLLLLLLLLLLVDRRWAWPLSCIVCRPARGGESGLTSAVMDTTSLGRGAPSAAGRMQRRQHGRKAVLQARQTNRAEL
jgi:hypothetical protein